VDSVTQTVGEWLSAISPAAFAFREPVAALQLFSDDLAVSQLVTVLSRHFRAFRACVSLHDQPR
jgi:hypothetical protein